MINELVLYVFTSFSDINSNINSAISLVRLNTENLFFCYFRLNNFGCRTSLHPFGCRCIPTSFLCKPSLYAYFYDTPDFRDINCVRVQRVKTQYLSGYLIFMSKGACNVRVEQGFHFSLAYSGTTLGSTNSSYVILNIGLESAENEPDVYYIQI